MKNQFFILLTFLLLSSICFAQNKIYKPLSGLYYGCSMNFSTQKVIDLSPRIWYCTLNEHNRKNVFTGVSLGMGGFLCNKKYLQPNNINSNHSFGVSVSSDIISQFRNSDWGLSSGLSFSKVISQKNSALTIKAGVNYLNVFTINYVKTYFGNGESDFFYKNGICLTIHVANYWKLLVFRNFNKKP